MKRVLLAALAASIFTPVVTSPAKAADFQPVPEIAPFNWTGIYIGLEAGGGFQETDFAIKDHECEYLNGLCSIKHNPDGLAAGGRLEGLWQFQGTGFVAGAAARGLFANFRDDRDAIFGIVKTETRTNSIFDAKGQLGWAFDRAYIYGTGGWAWVDREARADIPILGARWQDDQFLDGFLFGAGAKFVVVDGTQTQSPSVIFGLEWNRIEVDGDFASDLKFRERKGGGPYPSVQSCSYCYNDKLKVRGDDTIDVVTGSVSIKF